MTSYVVRKNGKTCPTFGGWSVIYNFVNQRSAYLPAVGRAKFAILN